MDLRKYLVTGKGEADVRNDLSAERRREEEFVWFNYFNSILLQCALGASKILNDPRFPKSLNVLANNGYTVFGKKKKKNNDAGIKILATPTLKIKKKKKQSATFKIDTAQK